MSEYLNIVSDKVKNHLKQLVVKAKLEDSEESLELMAKAWVEKLESYKNQVENRELLEVDKFEKDDERGALLITYSGSLLCVGPLENGVRKVGYTSIGLRTDVPEGAIEEHSEIAGDVSVDEAVSFKKGPIKKSSSIYKIAVVKKSLDKTKQIELLDDVTQILTDDFIEVNKTIVI